MQARLGRAQVASSTARASVRERIIPTLYNGNVRTAMPDLSDVIARLEQKYPKAKYELDWANPYQLLIATILAAQATDERVNKVTPALFGKWPTPQAMVTADQAEPEQVVSHLLFPPSPRFRGSAVARSRRRLAAMGDKPSGYRALNCPSLYRPWRAPLFSGSAPSASRRPVRVMVWTDEAPPIGARVDFEAFTLNGRTVESIADVAWVTEAPDETPARYRLGLSVFPQTDPDLAALEAMLAADPEET